jgi:hypothetical protein
MEHLGLARKKDIVGAVCSPVAKSSKLRAAATKDLWPTLLIERVGWNLVDSRWIQVLSADEVRGASENVQAVLGCATQAAIRLHSQFAIDVLRDSQPVESDEIIGNVVVPTEKIG